MSVFASSLPWPPIRLVPHRPLMLLPPGCSSVVMYVFEYQNCEASKLGLNSQEVLFNPIVYVYELDGFFFTHVKGNLSLRFEWVERDGLRACAKGRQLRDWVAETFGRVRLRECKQGVGVVYPRMFRVGMQPDLTPLGVTRDVITQSYMTQLMLVRRMMTVFETIHPHPRNLRSFGLEIREIFMSACMEVESACRAILRANGYRRVTKTGKEVPEKRWNTTDCVKLRDPMLLDTYQGGTSERTPTSNRSIHF